MSGAGTTPGPAGGPEQPAKRYPRTTNGLIGSMVAVVVLVLGFVVFRGTFRDQTQFEQERFDYLEAATAAQTAGEQVAYPRTLPSDWLPNSGRYVGRAAGTGKLRWGIGFLIDDDRFVGIAQEDDDLDDLLDEYVDEDTTQGADYTATGSVATTWQTWSDAGGDHAYSATLDGSVVLVYGSASPADQERLIGWLTDEAVPEDPSSGSPQPSPSLVTPS